MGKATRNALLALASALMAALALGQMRPGTPVVRFKLPLFNELGFRSWYLRGEKGIYDNENQIRIEDMTISQYSADGKDLLVSRMKSPEATFLLNDSRAYGPGRLEVESAAFKVTGQDWNWDGKLKEINIKKDVHVVINGEIGNILK